MQLRDLRWEDFDPLTESYWAQYDERARGEPVTISLFAEKPSREEEVGWFAGLFRRVLAGEGVAVVADVDGHAVGLCEIHPTAPGGAGSEGGHVGELGILIDRAHRGQGYGRAMIVAVLARARPRYEIVRLSVVASNERARRLYLGLGFVPFGRLPDGIRRGTRYTDLEMMSVDLRRWRPPPANR